ncbi:MAG: tripartite tricarboxylate transporter substrate binding protein [Rubritepida sp.]|jgi:tripartite-type tricarboxylate transporter receptor subunit TctC|nr:tripartite tricarboxylate transporter substrate binding protein [Rubritepida sp.]
MRLPLPRRALLASPLLAGPAFAQGGFPDRPLRMVVGFPPGGLTDIVARATAEGMSAALGQPVVVENRPGAAGNLATEQVARAAPDGLTMLMAYCGQVTINPFTYGNMPVDPSRDLIGVTRAVRTSVALVVHPDFPARDFAGFLAELRRQPGRVNYATAGSGSLLHVVAELLQRRTGTEMTSVHFRGSAAAIPEVLAGRVPVIVDPVPTVAPHIQAGRLRALMVAAEARAPQLPDVPTAAEVGLNDFVFDNWFGLLAPAGTPPARIERLNEAAAAALRQPALVERLAAQGIQTAPTTPAEVQRLFANEARVFAEVIRAANIRAD